jgi:hypothetical protein
MPEERIVNDERRRDATHVSPALRVAAAAAVAGVPPPRRTAGGTPSSSFLGDGSLALATRPHAHSVRCSKPPLTPQRPQQATG